MQIAFLKRWSRVMTLGVAASFLIGLGYMDYVTNPDLSFLIFYFIPILLCAWFVGPKSGLAMAAASSIIWVAADVNRRGSYHHWAVPYWNLLEKVIIFMTVSYLFARTKAAKDQENHTARTDPLTRIPNRRAFTEQAEREILRAKRYRHFLSVAYVDIDDFKKINDARGHDRGDELLKLAAQALQTHVRGLDLVARIGGDEFAILLPEIDSAQANAALEKIRLLLKSTVQSKGFGVTFSIGAVTFRTPPDSVSDMLRKADRLMYLVKRGGKNNLAMLAAEPTLSAVI